MRELEPWPVCCVRGCGNEFRPERAARGYTTCLDHWRRDPLNAMPPLVLMDVNKSNPTITRSPKGFLSDEYASRTVRSELRQTRSYISLDAKEKIHG